ncbi:hypothetical protein [Moorena bouillonii]|uniref:Uncharacterized protein n=1 Tax=Moorena bouillonii PNG TaxID=568701 RepID=A0A1U7N0N6_9CYAN|nr:hypothetical protein [Moorena bouillonii]OLT59509.1 hypothetical protein BJP37_11170 [Moorena bouillonii PNG]
MTTSLEEALNTVSQLPPEQQAMLVEIIQNRLIESRRQEIAEDANYTGKGSPVIISDLTGDPLPDSVWKFSTD